MFICHYLRSQGNLPVSTNGRGPVEREKRTRRKGWTRSQYLTEPYLNLRGRECRYESGVEGVCTRDSIGKSGIHWISQELLRKVLIRKRSKHFLLNPKNSFLNIRTWTSTRVSWFVKRETHLSMHPSSVPGGYGPTWLFVPMLGSSSKSIRCVL